MRKNKDRILSFSESLREAHEQLLAKDKRVIVLGQGVSDPKGVFGTTLNLHKRFGNERIIDIPIAENAMTGVAMGAALAGMRPIFVHMRMDFLLQAMDQIVNHAAKWSYMFNGQCKPSLVIRAIIGRGWGPGAQHSQSLQALFMHSPGLRVVMPSTAYDAKGLLAASVYEGSPVIFIEHRFLYQEKSTVPKRLYKLKLGQARRLIRGKDVTLIGLSYMVKESLKARLQLKKKGIDAEVIDLVSLNPLDEETLIKSVRKTGRVIIADTGCLTAGVSAEISARITEKCFRYLKAAPVRIALPDCPTPASSALEKFYYPDSSDIVRETLKLLKK